MVRIGSSIAGVKYIEPSPRLESTAGYVPVNYLEQNEIPTSDP